jgi:heme/copper-type cytochrome/quinol oxidase subunit 3
VSPEVWPPTPPSLDLPAFAVAALLASSSVVAWADSRLSRGSSVAPLWLALPLLLAAFAANAVAPTTPPTQDAYGAIVHAFLAIDGFFAACAIVLAVFALARQRAGKLCAARRVTFDNAKLFWHYTVAQTTAGILMVHLFPRIA